jgi:hypothetical protein
MAVMTTCRVLCVCIEFNESLEVLQVYRSRMRRFTGRSLTLHHFAEVKSERLLSKHNCSKDLPERLTVLDGIGPFLWHRHGR